MASAHHAVRAPLEVRDVDGVRPGGDGEGTGRLVVAGTTHRALRGGAPLVGPARQDECGGRPVEWSATLFLQGGEDEAMSAMPFVVGGTWDLEHASKL